MIFEVSFVVSGARNQWAVTVHRPPGKYWDQTDLIAYFNLGRPLPDFNTIPAERQASIQGMLDEVSWLLEATPEEVSQKYYKRVDDATLAKASRIVADALYHKNLAGSLGLDSNWGQGDLIAFGTALIDMTEEQSREITEPKRAADGRVLQERSWLINYEAKALPATVNKWRDPGQRVVLDRAMTPWTWAEVVIAG